MALNVSGMDKVLGHDITAVIDGNTITWAKGMTKGDVIQSYMEKTPSDKAVQVYHK